MELHNASHVGERFSEETESPLQDRGRVRVQLFLSNPWASLRSPRGGNGTTRLVTLPFSVGVRLWYGTWGSVLRSSYWGAWFVPLETASLTVKYGGLWCFVGVCKAYWLTLTSPTPSFEVSVILCHLFPFPVLVSYQLPVSEEFH